MSRLACRGRAYRLIEYRLGSSHGCAPLGGRVAVFPLTNRRHTHLVSVHGFTAPQKRRVLTFACDAQEILSSDLLSLMHVTGNAHGNKQ